MKTKILLLFGFLFSALWLHAADSDTIPRPRSESLFEQMNKEDQIFFRSGFLSADQLMSEGNYEEALPLLAELSRLSPSNANINFKIGICYSNLPSSGSKAIPYLVKAAQNFTLGYTDSYRENTSSVFSLYYLARAYHNNYQFDLALQYFRLFKKYVPAENKALNEDVNQRILMAYNALEMQKKPVPIRLENAGKGVNSEYPDYCPVVSPDGQTLYFTSRREGNTGGKKDEKGKFYEDIYFSKRSPEGSWGPAVNMGPGLNTSGHEAAVSISKDGNRLFVYRDDQGDGNLYYSDKVNGKWSSLKKLDPEINSRSWESHAFLSADGKRLYFVSDRPGGFGGRDIYYSDLQKNGKWGVAVNMGPVINSPFDEDGPWVSDDGSRIIYSSNGPGTMGGFDIFSSERNPQGVWASRVNLGYPVNSTDDDVFFTYAPDRNSIYYSSGKYNGFGKEDIYEMAIIPRPSLVTMFGSITDRATGDNVNARLLVTDPVNGNLIAEEVSGAGDPGYDVSLSVGKTYRVQIFADGYRSLDTLMMHPESVAAEKEKKDFYMDALPRASFLTAVSLKHVHFDFDKAEIRSEDEGMLSMLTDMLKENPDLGIVVDAHTDNRGSYEYNIVLSERRAASVKQYFTEQGVEPDRVLTSHFGFTQPATTNDNAAGRQLNRRAEFHLFFMSE